LCVSINTRSPTRVRFIAPPRPLPARTLKPTALFSQVAERSFSLVNAFHSTQERLFSCLLAFVYSTSAFVFNVYFDTPSVLGALPFS
jgi:hypothetical protein